MAKGDEPIYRGMVNDSNKKKVGGVSVWRNESRAGLSYLPGIISKSDGSKLRIVLFEARKNANGRKQEETEDEKDGF